MSESITNLCNCPEGFVEDPQNPGVCIGVEEIPATDIGGDSLELRVGFQYSSHNDLGAVLYNDITSLAFPLQPRVGSIGGTATAPYTAGDDIPVTTVLTGTPWNNPVPLPSPDATTIHNAGSSMLSPSAEFPGYGRLGRAGVLGWNLALDRYIFDSDPAIIGGGGSAWHGFEVCVEAPTTKQYVIGIAANNFCRFSIDGQLIFNQDESISGTSGLTWFKYWRLFPITLSAGNHVIRLEGKDSAPGGAWAAEIYDLTEGQIQNITSELDLESSLIFSTKDFIGEEVFDFDRYSCPPGYELIVCEGVPFCRGQITAELDCCWRLVDCETQEEFITETDLAQYDGQVISYPDGDDFKCYEVSPSSCLCGTPIPSPLASAKGADFIYVTDGVNIISDVAGTYRDVDITVTVDTDIEYRGPYSQEQKTLLAGTTTTVRIYADANSNLIDNEDPTFSPFPGQLPQYAFVFETSETTGISLELIDDCTNTIDISEGLIIGSFDTCEECLPKCYVLTDCTGVAPSINIDDTIEPQLGSTLKLDVSGTSVCFDITELEDCPGDEISIGDITIEDSYANCEECLDSLVSYDLIPCDSDSYASFLGVPKTEIDLDQFVGSVIRLNNDPDFLCTVSLGTTIVAGQITITNIEVVPGGCPSCEPEQRDVAPNDYNKYQCPIDEVIEIKCKFADSVYAMYTRMRFGVKTCCEFDLDKIDVKNSLLDLGALYDPELCQDQEFAECCPPPCNVTAEIAIPLWMSCNPPENVTAQLTTP